jgi:membrane associated rhomboid family serine protease
MSGGSREPMFNLPGSLVFLILALAAVHGFREFFLSAQVDAEFMRALAFVPGRFAYESDPDAVAAALTKLAAAGDRDALLIAQFFLDDGRADYRTLVSYAFLHGDWTHLGMNVLWLAAFGAPVAQRFGAGRTIAFFLFTAAAGAGAHYLVHPVDLIPVVGASASVSGMMAAALRFIFQPGAPLGPSIFALREPGASAQAPALPLRRAWRDKRVVQFALLWFAINLVVGLLAKPLGIAEGGVAWEAHAGGFLAGFLFFGLFDPPAAPARAQEAEA